MRRNNLLTFIASLALVTSFIMPANAAKHKELPALGDTQIQIFDKTVRQEVVQVIVQHDV